MRLSRPCPCIGTSRGVPLGNRPAGHHEQATKYPTWIARIILTASICHSPACLAVLTKALWLRFALPGVRCESESLPRYLIGQPLASLVTGPRNAQLHSAEALDVNRFKRHRTMRALDTHLPTDMIHRSSGELHPALGAGGPW
jgi:hypothetical protein